MRKLSGQVRFDLGEPNPVLVKELRSRFRGPRAFVLLTTFLGVLTVVAWFMYAQAIRNYESYSRYGGYNYGGGGPSGSDIGQGILVAVAFVEVLLVAVIGPALMADSVTGEVERQTWDLLKATPLSGASIMLGKMSAALGYVLLLALCALPVMSLGFIFGGVSLTNVLRAQGSMLTAGVLFLAIGGFWSSMVRRTSRAAILGYATVGLLLLTPVLVPMLWWVLGGGGGGDDNPMEWRAWSHLMMALSPPAESVMTMEAFQSGAKPPTIWLTWVLAMLLRVVVALFLLLMASARIRPLARWAVPAVALLLAGLVVWAVGVSTLTPWGRGTP